MAKTPHKDTHGWYTLTLTQLLDTREPTTQDIPRQGARDKDDLNITGFAIASGPLSRPIFPRFR